jgi:hypothetical protein
MDQRPKAGGVYMAAVSARCSSLTEWSRVLGWHSSFAVTTGVLGHSSFAMMTSVLGRSSFAAMSDERQRTGSRREQRQRRVRRI